MPLGFSFFISLEHAPFSLDPLSAPMLYVVHTPEGPWEKRRNQCALGPRAREFASHAYQRDIGAIA